MKRVPFILVMCLACPALFADEAEGPLKKLEDDVEKATDQALAYLAKQQQADGSFGETSGRGGTAVTSLSVMAFLAKGHTPGAGPYGKVINQGIDFVLASRQRNDLLGPPSGSGAMYNHCISTLMLSEVSGMVDEGRQKKVDRVLPGAMKLILAAQQVRKGGKLQGGWRYQPNAPDSDISCSGWALMALRSARNSGCDVPAEAIDEGMKFILNCRSPDGGFAYQPGAGSGPARTGTGLLCLELCGKHGDDACKEAGAWILKHLPRTVADNHFYYGLYYCSQGMFQLGGEPWPRWAKNMYELMLPCQVKDGALAGSWPQASGGEAQAGPVYATAMTVLALSVSCRQLPIYQR